MTAGYAAADVSYSASAKVSYGNFGEQNTAGTTYGYSDTFDFGVSGSGEAGGVAYSASMTIDEDAASNALGAFSMSSNGLSYTYDANDIGGLETANGNGLDEAAGDWKIAYAANGFSAGYEVDEDVEGRSLTTLGYSANALTLGLEVKDDDGSAGAGGTINTVSVGYTWVQ